MTADEISVPPRLGGGVVNAALRFLGVTAASGKDEWDTVDLGRWRGMEALGAEESG